MKNSLPRSIRAKFAQMLLLLFVISITQAIQPAAAQQKKLVVYTYDSFSTQGGLGSVLKPIYEERCKCELVFRTFEDAGTILNTLRIEQAQSEADLVVGIDNNMSALAKEFFIPHGLGGDYSRLFDMPIKWVDSKFVPFDYGWFAFIYNKEKLPFAPNSFQELMSSSLKVIIQDPRTSSPGLGLLLWVKKVYGDKAGEAWQKIFPRITTVTKGWSEAYGLFLNGEADMVLSYNTSPIYHEIQESDNNYRAAIFEEGSFLQVEIAAIAKTSKQPELARDFLRFLISPSAQRMVATTNWMFPVLGKAQQVQAPKQFEGVKETMQKAKTLTIAPGLVRQERKAWIEEWLLASRFESNKKKKK